MDSNFSPKVKEIISYSREEALRLGNDFIGTEHLRSRTSMLICLTCVKNWK